MPLSQTEQKIATIFRSEVDRQEINQRAMAISIEWIFPIVFMGELI